MSRLHENRYNQVYRPLFDRLPLGLRRTLLARFRPRLAALLEDAYHGKSNLSVMSYRERRCIYIHVPKTGGTSIKALLCQGPNPSHATLFHYSVLFPPAEFKTFFKFGFVRNPWDRVYSSYTYLIAGGKNEQDRGFGKRILLKYRDFEDFVLHGLHKHEVRGHIHFLPQWQFLSIRSGMMPIDFIGYYESLPQDFAFAARRIGLPEELPWNNRTQGREVSYKAAYTPAMKQRVAEVYAQDIALFGYEFDTFTPHRLNRKG